MQLDEKERKWVLSPYDYEDVKDNSGNLLYRIKACVDNFPIWINTEDGKKERVLLKQKRVVTFNPSLAEKKRIEINKQIDKAINLSHSQAKKEEYGDSSKYVKFVEDVYKRQMIRSTFPKLFLKSSISIVRALAART